MLSEGANRSGDDEVISTIVCHDLESLIDSLRAAEALGLGVRVENRWTQLGDRVDEEFWYFYLYQAAPITEAP